jgi:hypothetical protein
MEETTTTEVVKHIVPTKESFVLFMVGAIAGWAATELSKKGAKALMASVRARKLSLPSGE